MCRFQKYFPLFFAFGFLVIIKILISIFIKSPWIFADETVYAETARNILHGEFFSRLQLVQTYPPGYPLFISAAFFITENPFIHYHGMLVINTLLTSSIIFPAYFLMRKFCHENFSILGAILVATLPAVMVYTFVVMSENLFTTLFVFSFWFFIESLDSDSKKWGILAGFSIFLLFFTRTSGIAMICGFFPALLYYSAYEPNSKSIRGFLGKHGYFLAAFIIPFILWTVYKKIQGPSSISGYNSDLYIDAFIHAMSDFPSIIQFLLLFLHEIEFLIISSYFIFFFLAIYLILIVFFPGSGRNDGKIRTIGSENYLSIRTGLIYVAISSMVSILITVTHMYIATVIYHDFSYQIFGRYLDPVVPIIAICGLIGLSLILSENKARFERFSLLTIGYTIPVAILFLVDFPTMNYKFPNTLSIFYLDTIPASIVGPFILFYICSVISISIIIIYYNKIWYVLIILFLILSAGITACTVQNEYIHSLDSRERNEGITSYLAENLNEDSTIFMSFEDYNSDYGIHAWWASQFFSKTNLIQNTDDALKQGPDFIISNKLLTKKVYAVSKTGFKLYGSTEREKTTIHLPYTIYVGYSRDRLENFNLMGGDEFLWTKNSSKILIDYPKNLGSMDLIIKIDGSRPSENPAQVIFGCNGVELKKLTATGWEEQVHIVVPQENLNEYFQLLEIRTTTWRPSDYGSSDFRQLGIRVKDVSVQKNATGCG